MPSEEEEAEFERLSALLASSINASAVSSADDIPDSKTRLEFSEIQARFFEERVRSLSQDIDERKKYAHRIFCLICAWLGGSFLLLVADGIARSQWFSLPEGVLLAIIGGTSADVLGIFYIVTHYLFPQSAPSAESPDDDSENSDAEDSN